MPLSPMEQRFLDLMDRIDQRQTEQIADLSQRIAAAEGQNRALSRRLSEVEQTNGRLALSLQSLNTMLAGWLDPPDWPPSSASSSGT